MYQIKQYNAYSKVLKCIESCNTEEQLYSCRSLLDNFIRLFNLDPKSFTVLCLTEAYLAKKALVF